MYIYIYTHVSYNKEHFIGESAHVVSSAFICEISVEGPFIYLI